MRAKHNSRICFIGSGTSACLPWSVLAVQNPSKSAGTKDSSIGIGSARRSGVASEMADCDERRAWA